MNHSTAYWRAKAVKWKAKATAEKTAKQALRAALWTVARKASRCPYTPAAQLEILRTIKKALDAPTRIR